MGRCPDCEFHRSEHGYCCCDLHHPRVSYTERSHRQAVAALFLIVIVAAVFSIINLIAG
jgi:hypothetical protein